MLRKALFLLFIITQIIISQSCSLINRSTPPDISLVDLKFTGVSVFETSAGFTLRLQNENPYDLEFSGAKHTIYLNGIKIGKGLVDRDFVVPKLGTITQEVTIHFSNLSLARNIQELIDAKDFNYQVDSVFFRPGVLGLSDISVSEQGSISLNR